MKKTAYILGYLIISCCIIALIRSYIFDNMWTNGILIAASNTYGMILYNKAYGKNQRKFNV